ncbi:MULTISPECIES: WYL domain-containing protein [unclassified Corynebacterium]|uniref:WYL domain-containing protein n=1 Tax=unclassified Corynebacterium TaxID=2624378 RepID=UPI0030A57B05
MKPQNDSPDLTLPQLLNLAPYFEEPKTFTEAATDLGLTVAQVRAGLEQLANLSRPGLTTRNAYTVTYSGPWTAQVIPAVEALAQPMKLTPAEAATLLLTLETLETSAALNDPEVVRSAAAKLREISWTSGAIVDTTPATAGNIEFAQVIQSAIRDRNVIEVEYRNASDERSVRLLDPVQVMAVEDITYLQAADHDDDAKTVKTFRIDRIESVRATDAQARWIAPRSVDPLDPYGFNEDETPEKWASIMVNADATWVSDYDPVFWSDEEDDGEQGYPAFIPMGNVDQAVSFVLRRAPSVEVIEPVSLHKAVIARAREGLEAYGYQPQTSSAR